MHLPTQHPTTHPFFHLSSLPLTNPSILFFFYPFVHLSPFHPSIHPPTTPYFFLPFFNSSFQLPIISIHQISIQLFFLLSFLPSIHPNMPLSFLQFTKCLFRTTDYRIDLGRALREIKPIKTPYRQEFTLQCSSRLDTQGEINIV